MFDAVVTSGETGMRKHDPAIYLLTADKLGV
jgi:FMN phosphatase YigB (HAD superfamily)